MSPPGTASQWHTGPGAAISDIEFVQFHPTALYLEGAPRFLLSEALRGEGARLRNAAGETFMHRYHALEELAPRDVVSRSIIQEMDRTGTDRVYLDLTHRDRAFIENRFPRIYQTCRRYGLDLATSPARCVPRRIMRWAAYGRIWRGRHRSPGSTPRAKWPGPACTEPIAWPATLCSKALYSARARAPTCGGGRGKRKCPGGAAPAAEFPAMEESRVREIASRDCAIVRSAAGIERAIRELAAAPPERLARPTLARHEARSVHTVATLIARCALARQESRGAHFRTDFPSKRSEFARHSLLVKNNEPSFV